MVFVINRYFHCVDVTSPPLYDEAASGQLGDRGSAYCRVEESPYSIGHGAGEIPGRSNLSDRATETGSC